MMNVIQTAAKLYGLQGYGISPVPGHHGGRNQIWVCSRNGENRFVLRFTPPGDRTEADLLAETEFVRYLSQNGAPVADVIPSLNGRLVELAGEEQNQGCLSLFAYAKGMLISDNGYRYRNGAPLEEYFFNTGKALGAIHRLSRQYEPVHRRPGFFDIYDMDYIDRLIPDRYADLRRAIARRLDICKTLPTDRDSFGLVHFDFCDGNYHVDMDTGRITVFDFDNCIRCWYMFDLAHVWTHGVGWFRRIPDPKARMEGMKRYFDTVLEGYRSETDVSDKMLEMLPLFIDMTIIENITDEFECAARKGEAPDDEDIADLAECLIRDIPYAGFGEA